MLGAFRPSCQREAQPRTSVHASTGLRLCNRDAPARARVVCAWSHRRARRRRAAGWARVPSGDPAALRVEARRRAGRCARPHGRCRSGPARRRRARGLAVGGGRPAHRGRRGASEPAHCCWLRALRGRLHAPFARLRKWPWERFELLSGDDVERAAHEARAALAAGEEQVQLPCTASGGACDSRRSRSPCAKRRTRRRTRR